MHHPPFDCGIDAFDGMKLNEGGERLAAIVRRHGHVERVMCGHVHRPIQVRWAGTMASIAPRRRTRRRWIFTKRRRIR